jgi:hypothetical protein
MPVLDIEAVNAVKDSVRDFGDDHYYLYPPTGERVPSVTTVLSATDGKPYLVPWSARISAENCVDNFEEIGRIIREEGRQAAIDLLKGQAKLIRERKADAGSYVHAVAEALVLWQASPEGHGGEVSLPDLPEHLTDTLYDDQPLPVVVDWMTTGFLNWVTAFRPGFRAAEMTVFNIGLGVAGTLDIIITLYGVKLLPDGRLVPCPGSVVTLCVDIKTGRILDKTVPEQLAAYRKMPEALAPLGELVPMPATDAAAVLHLRPEHRHGFRFRIIPPAKDAKAWNRFRRAVELQQGRAEDDGQVGCVVYPLRPDGTMQSPYVYDCDGPGRGRAIKALLAALGDDLDLEMLSVHTSAELLALKGIGDKSIPVIRDMLAAHGLHLADEPPASGKEAA